MAKFYYGTNSLTYRSDLPAGMEDIPAGGLLVTENGLVYAANSQPNNTIIARTRADSGYTAWEDLTGSITNGVTKITTT